MLEIYNVLLLKLKQGINSTLLTFIRSIDKLFLS
ncbi:MAG: hypothetical protein JWM28_2755 [Chitinophagaceae bacterium]|nr:hypothetical protein [Chitinophagaceae bacterium]